MSYIDRIKVRGTEYDVLDRRVRLADGQDFDYGTLFQGGINNTNGYTTGAHLRRSETYWPVIEGPVNVVMQNGLTGYIRLYNSSRTMIDPGKGMPGSDTTNHVLIIAKNATMTLTMKEYNPNTAYFRFYFSCGTEDNISALVRENARIVPLQTVVTPDDLQDVAGDVTALDEDVSDLRSAIENISGLQAIGYEIGRIDPSTGIEESAGTRIRSDFISAVESTQIDVQSGYRVLWVAFNSNKEFVNGKTTFLDDGKSFTIASVVTSNPTTAYIRLVYRRTDGNAIAQTDLDAVESFVVQKSKIDTIEEKTNNNSEILSGNVSISNFDPDLRAVFVNKLKPIDLTYSQGYMTISGNLDTSSSSTHYAAMNVANGDKYRITSRHGSALRTYVLINENNEVVEYYPSSSVSTITDMVEITIPQSGTLYVNTYTVSLASVLKLEGIVVASAGAGLTGKTWYALGDSITAYQTGYHALIGEETGAIVTNGGVSGSGYMKPINNKTFVDRANLSEVYDIVTVFGSVNDMQYVGSALGTESDTGTATLGGCFNTLIDNLYASGNYHVGIIAPIPQGTTSGNPSNTTGTFAQYTELLEKVCKRRGVPYLDLWHCSNMQPWDATFAETYMQDNTHPNTDGHKIFAPRIKAFIQSL